MGGYFVDDRLRTAHGAGDWQSDLDGKSWDRREADHDFIRAEDERYRAKVDGGHEGPEVSDWRSPMGCEWVGEYQLVVNANICSLFTA